MATSEQNKDVILVPQDIDAILAGRTEKRQIGSAAGNTFSIATFAAEPAVTRPAEPVTVAKWAVQSCLFIETHLAPIANLLAHMLFQWLTVLPVKQPPESVHACARLQRLWMSAPTGLRCCPTP